MQTFINNTSISLLIGFIVVLAYIALYYRDKYNKTQDEYLDLADKNNFFDKKPSIMRHEERLLFDILTKLYSEKYFIFPQVKVSDVLTVKENVKDHDNLYREIDHRSLDYVFFDRQAMAPTLAIELNGASHFQFYRKNRDQKIGNILAKAGIPLVTIPVTENINDESLKQLINPLLTLN